MGHFRRFKPSDYTADQCRVKMNQLRQKLVFHASKMSFEELNEILDKWGCFRELLARHENQNKSPLDQ